jgi:hypothetical protein
MFEKRITILNFTVVDYQRMLLTCLNTFCSSSFDISIPISVCKLRRRLRNHAFTFNGWKVMVKFIERGPPKHTPGYN